MEGSAMSMILHGYYRSSAAFRVRIALALKGIAYEQIPHHLRHNDHRLPRYAALNPQKLVPALELDGEVLSQSLAIIEYLDEVYPDPAFLPTGPTDRAYVRSLAQIVACDIHPLDNLRVLRYLRESFGQDEKSIGNWYNHWIAQGFAAMEARLSGDRRTRRYCYGDRPGLADICLVPQVVNAANYALDMAAYPTIQRIFEACIELDAFAASQPQRQPDAE